MWCDPNAIHRLVRRQLLPQLLERRKFHCVMITAIDIGCRSDSLCNGKIHNLEDENL
jgi:hypothetical protein